MDIDLYTFIVLFIIIPLIVYKFTDIPQWFFKKAKKIKPKLLLLVTSLVLLCIAVSIATVSDSIWNVRFVSLGVAALACALHYIYSEEAEQKTTKEDTKDQTM